MKTLQQELSQQKNSQNLTWQKSQAKRAFTTIFPKQ